jgi:hypothetical protein
MGNFWAQAFVCPPLKWIFIDIDRILVMVAYLLTNRYLGIPEKASSKPP